MRVTRVWLSAHTHSKYVSSSILSSRSLPPAACSSIPLPLSPSVEWGSAHRKQYNLIRSRWLDYVNICYDPTGEQTTLLRWHECGRTHPHRLTHGYAVALQITMRVELARLTEAFKWTEYYGGVSTYYFLWLNIKRDNVPTTKWVFQKCVGVIDNCHVA